MRDRRRIGWLLVFVAATVSGCFGDDEPIRLTRYPLEAGWSWTYRRSLTVTLLDGTGTSVYLEDSVRVDATGESPGAPPTPFALVSSSLAAPDDPAGRQYFTQDAAGLHHLLTLGEGSDLSVYPKPGGDVATPDRRRSPLVPLLPAASSTDTAPRLVLAFPLTAGSTWLAVREPRPVTRQVTAETMIDTPVGRRRALVVETRAWEGTDVPYVDWIGEEGLLRRRAEAVLDDFLFPGDPARERVVELVELTAVRTP